VRYKGELVEAKFLTRENRFVADVLIDGFLDRAHVPNSGRMRELLTRENTMLLRRRSNPKRKTKWDLVAVETPTVTVSVDSRVPNRVVAEALEQDTIPELARFDKVRPELQWGSSRLDFLLSGDSGDALVEVKGCTLVLDGGLALFPDAPTSRGARHVRELAMARREGFDSFLLVIVQRPDGRVFAPNDMTDRAFGDALREAASEGVEVLAYSTDVTRGGVDLSHRIPVDLEAALEVVPS
jgi:sugar fermentation stimulation protein A